MERFTASDVNFFLDSVAIAFSVDTVPSKITCWVLQDTVDIQGRPFPNFNAKPLAVASILRSQMAGKDTFTFYTVPFKHKSINANSASPNSFYVSLSTLTSTVTTTGAPFFGVPATKNSIFVLTDNTTDNTGRSIDYTIDRMHWTATRTDGSYVSWNNIAHEFFLTSQTTATDTAWLYPNMFMIAYVSYNNSGVNTAPLTGNALGQNYPNAFNSSTEIKYSLENESKVSLKVYNTLGMEIGTLADDFETAGEHQVSFNGSNLPSGTYFYTLRAGDYSATKRMVIAK
jgi:hypothetical protein